MRYLAILFVFITGCYSYSKRKDNLQSEGGNSEKVYKLEDDYYNPLFPSDLMLLTEFVIDVSLKNFNDSNYSILPIFDDEKISIDDIKESIIHDDFKISEKSYEKMYQDHILLRGKSIQLMLRDKDKLNNLDRSFTDLLIVISSPMVDREQGFVFFRSRALFKHKQTISQGMMYYGFRLVDDNWVLFCTLPPPLPHD